jgi:hypothetical protein
MTMILESFVTVFDLLHCHCVRHCSLPKVYLVYMMFQQLTLPPFSGYWLLLLYLYEWWQLESNLLYFEYETAET